MQKNDVKGESIGNGITVHPQGCPVEELHFRITHLQRHGVTGTAPLAFVRHKDKWVSIFSTEIMSVVRAVIRKLVPTIGFTPQDVSAHSLQEGGG